MSDHINSKPSMKQTYFNLSPQEADLQHRIKTLLHLQETIIQSTLRLGPILHTDTLSEVVEALHKMRSDLERQALAFKLEQSIQISDASRGSSL